MITEEQRSKLEEKLSNMNWTVPNELFGDVGADINDFESFNYVFFIDNVKSVQKLREGLECLSPLADDALTIANEMTRKDFQYFKRIIPKQRIGEGREESKKYRTLLIPERFIVAIPLSEAAGAPLGATLIRLMREEYE